MDREQFVDWFNGHPLLAAIAAFFLPGIPHILMGEILLGGVLLVTCAVTWYWFVGWIVQLLSAFTAYQIADSLKPKPPTG